MSAAPDLPGDLLALAREDLASAEALDREERVSDDIGLLMQLCQDTGFELPPISRRPIVSRLMRLPSAAGSETLERLLARMPCNGRRLPSSGLTLRFAQILTLIPVTRSTSP